MEEKERMVDLIELRKEKGLTQKNVADALGVSTTTINAWEHRRGNISKTHIRAYAKFMNINPMEIIDSERDFPHYDDKKYSYDDKPNIKSILSLCFELVPDRVVKVFRYARTQLSEQLHKKVTYNDLIKDVRHHDLVIDGEIYSDRDIRFFQRNERQLEDFFGSIPGDLTKTLKVKNNSLFPLYNTNQKIFLKDATLHISSGTFVVAKNKIDSEYRIFQYRSTDGDIYLFPLEKRDEGIDSSKAKFLWERNPDWELEYIIILS
ncbi:helix-turn-helix transcriptional regulator (plasmid) [Apilactobacillus apisilvae]|uniref:Helix-turn-helix transcriptional regulator n=1 Tax=Apilactobacillus apisilvae TaxID=2923364 RepID=A0ABY4PK93_9LACO|nr:helix-turn-helix transcriptional regulator [Apilactobacillus apisilvae]UQS85806.1 helix-turn-helix transcriptional regulator [Apilactobacillus apisilvae]